MLRRSFTFLNSVKAMQVVIPKKEVSEFSDKELTERYVRFLDNIEREMRISRNIGLGLIFVGGMCGTLLCAEKL
jgi:hypothetical protein